MTLFAATIFFYLAQLYGASTVPSCICTMEYAPVCGVDGKTYGNKCSLNCASVQMAYQGQCQPIVADTLLDSVCACPRIYLPVCGQDGKTYANQCEMNCAGVAFFQDGACSASGTGGIQKRVITPCICTFLYKPVCGSDGVTYGNECNLNCAADEAASIGATTIIKAHDGPCPTTTRSIPTTTTAITTSA